MHSTSNAWQSQGRKFQKKRDAYRKRLCNTHLNLLSLYFSIEISNFFSFFYWNLYFLFTFLMKSLLSLYFSIEISAFSLTLYFLFTFLLKSLHSLHYWNLYFPFTFLLKPPSTFLLKPPPTFFLLFYWNLYFLFFYWNLYFLCTRRLKSLLSLYFSIEISTFSSLFFWNL